MRTELSTRQAEVARYVRDGMQTKRIAAEMGLSIETVRVHVKAAAAKLPGDTAPRHKLTLWFLNTHQTPED